MFWNFAMSHSLYRVPYTADAGGCRSNNRLITCRQAVAAAWSWD
jgi:hypothetical protein